MNHDGDDGPSLIVVLRPHLGLALVAVGPERSAGGHLAAPPAAWPRERCCRRDAESSLLLGQLGGKTPGKPTDIPSTPVAAPLRRCGAIISSWLIVLDSLQYASDLIRCEGEL